MSREEDEIKARDLVRVGLKHLKESGADLSEFGLTDGSQTSIATRHRREDEAVTLYDRMTPAERTELARTNPEEFERVLKAKEEAGYRDLMRGPGNVPRY